MLFTERKALEVMFTNLEDDKRQIKQQARQDIKEIEGRQMNILDRIERLDDKERAEIDVEGTITELVNTTKKLSDLLPNVSADQVINKIKEDYKTAVENVEVKEEKPEVTQRLEAAAQEQRFNSKPVQSAPKKTVKSPNDRNFPVEKRAEVVLEILKEAGYPLKSREIFERFEDKTGIKIKAHSSAINTYRQTNPKIIKKGHSYFAEKEEKTEGVKKDSWEGNVADRVLV